MDNWDKGSLADALDNSGSTQDGVGLENEQNCSSLSSSFDIPELPTGDVLLLELLSSWGDDSLVGLSSLELFSSDGTRPPVMDILSDAPETIEGNLHNLIAKEKEEEAEEGAEPGMGSGGEEAKDSRRTSRSRTPWLCKYRQGPQQCLPVQITVRFWAPQTLAMIRISNYFGSRVHSLRGVRNLRIWLDRNCIFVGEIGCASSSAAPPVGDIILFTTNEEILASIAENDGKLALMGEQEEEGQRNDEEEEGEEEGTGNAEPGMAKLSIGSGDGEGGGHGAAENPPLPLPLLAIAANRPTTGHSSSSPSSSAPSSVAGNRHQQKQSQMEEEVPKEAEKDKEGTEEGEEEEEEESVVRGRVFHMELLANWGCPDAIGLTGIQFLGPRFEPVDEQTMRQCVLRCEPTDCGSGGEGSLTNIINGHNLTCRRGEMWLISPPSAGAPVPPPVLSFTFPSDIPLSGISIWNYNASPELSYAGVRCARFYANGRPLSLGVVLLRKAPGFVFFDFVQDVMFDRCFLSRPPSSRPQTRSISAFIFQLRLLSSWGDQFYIGLNGIELFGRQGRPLRLRPRNLAAFPESVNCLASVRADPRSSDKLIDGVNDTPKAHHMWLTPLLPNSCARVFLIFDSPTPVSRIRIYNYRKTPERGVRHVALSADDLLLCSGAEVPISTAQETGILDIPLGDTDL